MAHVIDSVVPNHGDVGDTVVINGSGFGAVQGASTVRFSPNELAAISVWSDTAITCTVPGTAVIGPLRVVVGGAEADSPRNADHFNLDSATFPASIQDIEFQNTTNDSDIPGDDNLIADARDYNALADLLMKLQEKVGIDGSADPSSLDFKIGAITGPQRLSINTFEAIPATAIPPPLPLPTPIAIGTTPHVVHEFPAGVDTEFMFRFTVPRGLDVTVPLGIVPVFVLSAPPGPAEAVVLDVEGDLDGIVLPPLGGPGVPVLIDFLPPGLPFFTGIPPIAAIPTSGAPPVAPPDTQVALRIKRLGTAGADTYGGGFQLDKVFVEYVV